MSTKIIKSFVLILVQLAKHFQRQQRRPLLRLHQRQQHLQQPTQPQQLPMLLGKIMSDNFSVIDILRSKIVFCVTADSTFVAFKNFLGLKAA